MLLLNELQELVQKAMEHGENRRENRQFRLMRKALKEWIKELKEAKNEPVVSSQ